MVTDSVVMSRRAQGQPEEYSATWDDLLKPGIEVVTPDPFQSGGAKWNILAGYGAKIKDGQSPDEASAYLKALLSHVSVQPASGREAMTTFVGGRGDVIDLVRERGDHRSAGGPGRRLRDTGSTILIENPIAVVKTSHNPAAAQAFVDYLRTSDGQRLGQSSAIARLSPTSPRSSPARSGPIRPVYYRRPRRLAGGRQAVLRP